MIKEREMAFKGLTNDAGGESRNPWEKSVKLEREHVPRQIVLAEHHLSLRGCEGKENVKGKVARVVFGKKAREKGEKEGGRRMDWPDNRMNLFPKCYKADVPFRRLINVSFRQA